MTRYRPPQPKSSPYISKPGYKALNDELKGLWTTRREVTAALSAAAAEGDRSENAEYIYRKKQLREIDRRIRYLQKRLDVLIIVDKPPTNQQQVFFGAWVELEDEEGNSVAYRIVGPDEFNVEKNWISMDSPVARALMKKSLDDEVSVQRPAGPIHYIITGIHYTED
ncbi:transcription elongation factor GreB [Nitrosomonas aestuarii]|uniref:transcription elongation factor GreB n=1 Tax=Nitrosomonas aestuarii TaxID=52441 RepID=UPI000D2F76A1|nr:transcription elongation factor GreB [Nitrosomonas aestuarii]PTN11432.1 transcription elongation factor GreB [Nitrosomonas aestuarii]